MKYELQSIISGKGIVEHGTVIQAAANYFKRSQSTSTVAQEFKHFKQQENKILEQFINDHNLWIRDINLGNYVSEGAEQKVYLKDSKNVIKLQLCLMTMQYPNSIT